MWDEQRGKILKRSINALESESSKIIVCLEKKQKLSQNYFKKTNLLVAYKTNNSLRFLLTSQNDDRGRKFREVAFIN